MGLLSWGKTSKVFRLKITELLDLHIPLFICVWNDRIGFSDEIRILKLDSSYIIPHPSQKTLLVFLILRTWFCEGSSRSGQYTLELLETSAAACIRHLSQIWVKIKQQRRILQFGRPLKKMSFVRAVDIFSIKGKWMERGGRHRFNTHF